MVLRLGISFIFLLNLIFIQAQENLVLEHTDKYDINYYSSDSTQINEFYFASDLLQFLNESQLQNSASFIDSFLRSNKLEFNQNILFLNDNTFKIELLDAEISQVISLTRKWFEEYNVNWLKMINENLNSSPITDLNSNKKRMLYYIYLDEKNRFYNPGNNIINSNITYILPVNSFKNIRLKEVKEVNTKRYSISETELRLTEINIDSLLEDRELKFHFPTINKQSVLKNSVFYFILEQLYSSNNFEISFGINQVFSNFSFKVDSNSIENLDFDFNKPLTDSEFASTKQKALLKLENSVSRNNLFYFNKSDIKSFREVVNKYSIDEFMTKKTLLNDRNQFFIEINDSKKLEYMNSKLVQISKDAFESNHFYKTNSLEFLNEKDTNLIKQLKLFMDLNPDYQLNLTSFSKKSEFLYIEKDIKDALLRKYNKINYRISKKRKLALFRSLNLFDRLTELGIEPERINCNGINGKDSNLAIELINLHY